MANYREYNSERETCEQRYKNARMNLLIVVAFTAINILLLITNTDTYFLFSAFIPYFITTLGMLVCGRFPDEYYTGDFAGMEFVDDSVFFILLIISIAIILVYLLAWFMSSKNRSGWLVFMLVLFIFDTLGMLVINGISLQSIIDILFHIWVIYYLIAGIKACNRLKSIPVEEKPQNENIIEENEDEIYIEENNEEIPNTPILRKAELDVKYKVLIETKYLNYDICYRRVKHTNELVINGNVYDEIKGVLEFAHILQAHIDGHHIAVGFTGNHSVIYIDEKLIAKKLRLF